LIKELFQPIFEGLLVKGSFDFGTLDDLTRDAKEKCERQMYLKIKKSHNRLRCGFES
jgi:hypothetical protein